MAANDPSRTCHRSHGLSGVLRRARFAGRLSLSVMAAVTSVGCRDTPHREITIQEGGNVTHVPVKTAFAEYIELPGERNELRITLAGYAASCERWVAPRDGEAAVSVLIVTPADVRPARASYSYSGIPKLDEPIKAPFAFPKAAIGNASHLFEPGGLVTLSRVDLDPHGGVKGSLAFEYPGDAEHPSTRIDGAFEAKVCRLSLLSR